MQRLVAPEEMLMQVPEYSLFAASCWCWLCFFFPFSFPFRLLVVVVCVSEYVARQLKHQGKPVLARKGIVAVFFFPSQVLEALFVGLASTTSALTLRTIPLVRCAALSRQFSTASPSPTPRRRDGRKLQIKCVCVGPGPSTTTRNLLAPATSAEYAVRVLLRYAQKKIMHENE